MNQATRTRDGQYEYRGFRIDNSHRSRWQIMIGDVRGWLASANTLRQAKTRIDHWYQAAQNGDKIAPQFIAAVDAVSRAACEAGEPVACPDAHTCRHGVSE